MIDYKRQIIMFITMIIVGMAFNPMNILAYDINHIYISLTLFYGGLLMASNMIWSHEIVHFLSMGHFNIYTFLTGIIMSLISTILLRKQLFVKNKQWLKRMIGHHSTALTTTEELLKDNKNFKNDPVTFRLAKDIVYNQKMEITIMENLIK